MSETGAALKIVGHRVWYALRCHLCETLIGWGIKVAPKDYNYSAAETAAEFYKCGRVGMSPDEAFAMTKFKLFDPPTTGDRNAF